MSSKIVGWLVGDWDGKKSDLKKNLNKKKIIWIKSEKEESCIFALFYFKIHEKDLFFYLKILLLCD